MPSIKHINLTLFVLMTILSTVSFGQDSNSIRKISLERRTGILVWDSGTTLGIVDSKDDFTDTNFRCILSEIDSASLTYKWAIEKYNGSKKDLSNDPLVLKRTQLEDAALSELADRTVQTYNGGESSQKLFVLMPEEHHQAMISRAKDPYEHHYELHRSQANFMFDLMRAMSEKGVKMLNLSEGPSRPLTESGAVDWQKSYEETKKGVEALNNPKFDPDIVANRFLRNGIWNDTLNENGSAVMARYFPSIPSFAVEDSELYLDGVSKVWAYFNPDPSPNDRFELSHFENAFHHYRGKNALDEDEANLNKTREYFKGLNLQERADVVNASCEERSQNMIKNALKLAGAQNESSIIFLRFGLAHSKSIMDSIKASNESFILISP